ncbi:MAG: radical SAM protein [Pseudomonadota bacterium]|nr:radical SAM protein [Pseudomonadota bacterium]
MKPASTPDTPHPAEPLRLPELRTWYVALTTACNFHCAYCTFDRTMYQVRGQRSRIGFPMLAPDEWIRALNGVANRPDYLIFTGGEPTLHRGFADILKGLEGYAVKVNSNLDFDVDVFADALGRGSRRIESCYLSYHPEYHAPDSYAVRVAKLREAGICRRIVVNVMARDNGATAITEQETVATAMAGLGLEVDFGRTDLPEEYLQSAFLLQRRVLCDPGHIVIAPNGDVYDCFSKMYLRLEARANLLTRARAANFAEINRDWIPCERFGQCNPCQEKRQRMPVAEFARLEALAREWAGRDGRAYALAPRDELQPIR